MYNFVRDKLKDTLEEKLDETDFKKMLPFVVYSLFDAFVSDNSKQNISFFTDILNAVADDYNQFETIIPNWYYFH